MADLGDTGEAFRYFVGFWGFVLSPRYRTATVLRWQQGAPSARALMILEGAIATTVGLGLPVLIGWAVGALLL